MISRRSVPTSRLLVSVATATAVASLLAGCAEAEPGTDRATAPSAAGSRPDTAAAGGATGSATGPATTSPSPVQASPQGRVLEVTVTGRDVTPAPSQVDLAVGETLTLVVTADVDTTVHAHGFELETPVPAGSPTSVQLTGTAPGVYEVELHDPDLLLLQVAVR